MRFEVLDCYGLRYANYWIADPFVEKQKKELFAQGISFQSHQLGNVGPAIFNQIGAGVITD